MSDRRDKGPLRLPPEREVPPRLRARVLHQAVRTDRAPARRPARIVPILAGLAVAAVVVGIVVAANRGGQHRAPLPPTGGGATVGQPVPQHDSVQTVIKALVGDAVDQVQSECGQATGVDVDFRMTTLRIKSPLGPIDVGAYADSTEHTQVFCTPFDALTSHPGDNIVSDDAPIALVAGSHVQGRLPSRNDPERETYYDGAWFAVMQGLRQIEARLVVDGVPGQWHASSRIHAFIFASTWAPLTAEQAAGEVRVEYRAINADGDLMSMPSVIASTTVTPAATPRLNERTTILPAGGAS